MKKVALYARVSTMDQSTGLTEKIDTNSAVGVAIFSILAAISQLERDLVADRVRIGLANARAKGKLIGRK